MVRPGLLAQRINMKLLGGFWLVILAVVLALGTILPLVRRLNTTEANAAMAAAPAAIDGARAFGYLERICELGPRLAGSSANTRQRQMVADHFKASGATIREQPLATGHPLTGERVAMVNLIGSWHPERRERVLIGAHYDTRPHPDEETDPDRLRLPFLGANDGASGVALLMEIANHLKEMKTP